MSKEAQRDLAELIKGRTSNSNCRRETISWETNWGGKKFDVDKKS